MRHKYNLQIFADDALIIDRSGADSLIPEEPAREIIQGVVTQSTVLSRGRKLPNMSTKTYKMPVLDMLPIAYFVDGDTGAKRPRNSSGIRRSLQQRKSPLSFRFRKLYLMIRIMTFGEK